MREDHLGTVTDLLEYPAKKQKKSEVLQRHRDSRDLLLQHFLKTEICNPIFKLLLHFLLSHSSAPKLLAFLEIAVAAIISHSSGAFLSM